MRLASIAVASAGALTSQVIAEDLNSQPESPDSNNLMLPGASFQLNPQPEPPGSIKTNRSLDWQGLNPQPEPPSKKMFKPGDWQGLNPQPEPP